VDQSPWQWVKDFQGVRTTGEQIISISIILYYLFMYIIFLFSLFLLKKEKSNTSFLILSFLIIFYITLLTGPVGHARFRLPINPFIIILSSFGLYHLSIRNKQLWIYH